jgi:hypothetical protein
MDENTNEHEFTGEGFKKLFELMSMKCSEGKHTMPPVEQPKPSNVVASMIVPLDDKAIIRAVIQAVDEEINETLHDIAVNILCNRGTVGQQENLADLRAIKQDWNKRLRSTDNV